MAKNLVRILILITPLVWIAYDVFAYYHWGNPATESATIARYAYYAPGFAFLCGVLCGHFFFEMREPIDWTTDHSKDQT